MLKFEGKRLAIKKIRRENNHSPLFTKVTTHFPLHHFLAPLSLFFKPLFFIVQSKNQPSNITIYPRKLYLQSFWKLYSN
jgi:hypothetical protein